MQVKKKKNNNNNGKDMLLRHCMFRINEMWLRVLCDLLTHVDFVGVNKKLLIKIIETTKSIENTYEHI